MKRIIYKKIADGVYQSKEHFSLEGNKKALAIFNLNSKTFSILDVRTNDALYSGSGSSKHKIMIKIKDALKTLGAEFSTEKRYLEYPVKE